MTKGSENIYQLAEDRKQLVIQALANRARMRDLYY